MPRNRSCLRYKVMAWKAAVLGEMNCRARLRWIAKPCLICAGVGLASLFGLFIVPVYLFGAGALVHGLLIPVALLALALLAVLLCLPYLIYLLVLRLLIFCTVIAITRRAKFCQMCGKPVELGREGIESFLQTNLRRDGTGCLVLCSDGCRERAKSVEGNRWPYCWGCGSEADTCTFDLMGRAFGGK